MKNLTLEQLYEFYDKMAISENYSEGDMDLVRELITEKERLIKEDEGGAFSTGVAYGNASTAGMGGVVSSQPSAAPGALNGPAWINGGGTSGSGDISVPYNPSGSNRMFQKIAAPQMGRNHGAKTGKKSRQKKIDLKALKSAISKKQDYTMGAEKPIKKVMNFDDFAKSQINKVTKVKEGVAFSTTKKKQLGMPWDPDRKEAFRKKVSDFVKSFNIDCDQIGNDFELVNMDGDMIAQVMFRDDYVGIKAKGNKFVDEFEYTEFGKIKEKLKSIIK